MDAMMSYASMSDHGNDWGIDVIVGIFLGIAVYNALEVYLLMFKTFRRKNTMYFWTILVSNSGVFPCLLYMFHLWGLAPNFPMAVCTSVGWVFMSTGQSFVLYLRLHLVLHDRRKLRWVLSLIIFTFVTLQVPATVTFLAMSSYPPDSRKGKPFKDAFGVFKVAQLVGFMIQEVVIAGIYLYSFRCTSQRLRMVREDQVKKMMHELIALVVIVVLLDGALTVNELVGNFQIQTTLRPAVYTVKLKAELFILNNLVTWMQTPSSTSASSASHPRKPAPLDRVSSGHTLTSETKPHPLHVPSRVSSRVSSRAPSCAPSRTGTPDPRPSTPGKSVAMAENEERSLQRNRSEASPHSMMPSESRVLTGNGVRPGNNMQSFEKIDLGD
ncbi:uncharacterized protein F4807DRAFT_469266 [Annulohypoxylon truncatum]|uniref:uncharacterized protein n=1 Tax=Annulohypoxylon truncatum TaxID=327061 RepID=UPI002007EC61|nr:uncharacterized protein F4807DRAFT_469266 [Annulohypoxylon truncatum]KAI1207429.1 hypothetical protein F4807DRAFT_469266 [Annulohypoxylon truncatum]